MLKENSLNKTVFFSTRGMLYCPTWDSAMAVSVDFIRMTSLASDWTAAVPPTALPSWTHRLSITDTFWNKVDVAFAEFQVVVPILLGCL